MIIRTNVLALFLLPFTLFFIGCSDFLERDPISDISDTQFFNDQAQAQSALVGVYAELNTHYLGVEHLVFGDLTSEQLTTRGLQNDWRGQADILLLTPGMQGLNTMYADLYRVVRNANFTLSGLDDMTEEEIDLALLGQFRGETLGLRAMAYLQLVSFFGRVPLSTELSPNLTSGQLGRADLDLVYGQIFADLTAARELLADRKPPFGRLNADIIDGLLARAYLQRYTQQSPSDQDLTEALAAAERVISAGNYVLVDPFTMWGVDQATVDNGQNAGTMYDVLVDNVLITHGLLEQFAPRLWPGKATSFDPRFHAEQSFYATYSDQDLRKDAFFITEFMTASGDTVIFAPGEERGRRYGDEVDGPTVAKYVDSDPEAGSSAKNIRVLRYAEIVLMAAEALNELNDGPTEMAYTYLNSNRTNNGLDSVSDLDYTGFREALYDEYMRELVAEGRGHAIGTRFFDIRSERVAASSNSDAIGTGKPSESITVTERARLLPIPTQAFDVNPGLGSDQNPGY